MGNRRDLACFVELSRVIIEKIDRLLRAVLNIVEVSKLGTIYRLI